MITTQFKSEFDTTLDVAIMGNDDYRYPAIKPMFNEYGFGFIIPGFKTIFIDGEQKLGNDINKFIEAHEVAHILLNHNESKNPNDEIQADLLARLLLLKHGYTTSAKLVVDKFEERHGIQYHAKIYEQILGNTKYSSYVS
jgi:hypothetical protein